MTAPSSNYIPIKHCYTCLEHFLLYVDFGLSEATAGFLAGLYHVVEDRDRFEESAHALLRSKVGLRTKA